MADIPFSSVTDSGGLPRLAPDLSFPSSLGSNVGYDTISGINAVGSLTTALSLTGRYVIDLIRLSGFSAETSTIKLTIDGAVIWNDTFTTPTGSTPINLIGSSGGTGPVSGASIQCVSSFLLEIQTTTDPSVTLDYLVRPIL